MKSRPKRLFVLLLILAGMGLAGAAGTTGRTAPAEPERPLVALFGFQIQLDPNRGWNPSEDYRNLTAASTFSQALWGPLSGVDGVAWVEREKLDAIYRELQLSAALSPSPAEQLKLGHLVSAQWLLMGAFSRASPTNSRSLRMQVIEMAHADVLDETRIDDLGDNQKIFQMRNDDLQRVAENAGHLLVSARRRAIEVAHRRGTLAILFARNTGAVPNLEHVETQILDAFEKRTEKDGIRLLRFPGARETLAEKQLVPADFARNDPNTRRRIADAYVWIEYGASVTNLPFDKLPLRLDAWFLSGNSHGALSETGTLCEARDLTDRLAERVARELRAMQASKGAVPEHTDVASFLLNEAHRNQEHDYYHRTVSLRQEWLSLACFFDPDHERPWREYLNTFDPVLNKFRNYSLSQIYSLSEEWEWYLDRFGVAGLADTTVHSTGVNEPERPADTAAFPVISALYYQPPVSKMRNNTPAERIYLSGLATIIEDRFMRFMSQLAPYFSNYPIDFGLITGLLRLSDPQRKAKLCEILVPRLGKAGGHYTGQTTSKERIDQALREAGWNEEKIDGLLRLAFPTQNKNVEEQKAFNNGMEEQTPTENVLVPQRLDVFPPLLNPPCQVVGFSRHKGPATVQAMAWQSNALWISLNTGQPSVVPSQAGLYRYSPETNCAQITKLFPPKSAPVLVRAASTSFLWLADEDGRAYRCRVSDGTVVVYGREEGLVLNSFSDAAVDAKGHIIFCGPAGRDRHSMLAWQVGGGSQWQLAQPPLDGYGPTYPLEITHIGLWDSLIICTVERNEVVIYNTFTGRWRIEPKVWDGIPSTAPRYWSRAKVSASSIITDEQYFWIGSDRGLTQLDHSGEVIRHKLTPTGLIDMNSIYSLAWMRQRGMSPAYFLIPKTRLVGQVMALSSDGDYLWIATSTRENRFGNREKSSLEGFFVFLLHKPTNKWVGYFPVSADVTAMATGQGRLWVGMNGAPNPLIEIDTRPLYAIPEKNWGEDTIPDSEIKAKIAQCSIRDQVRYAFVCGDYEQVVRLLPVPEDLSGLDLEELLLLAWSHDAKGLDQPDVTDQCMTEILLRNPSHVWKRVAREALGLGPEDDKPSSRPAVKDQPAAKPVDKKPPASPGIAVVESARSSNAINMAASAGVSARDRQTTPSAPAKTSTNVSAVKSVIHPAKALLDECEEAEALFRQNPKDKENTTLTQKIRQCRMNALAYTRTHTGGDLDARYWKDAMFGILWLSSYREWNTFEDADRAIREAMETLAEAEPEKVGVNVQIMFDVILLHEQTWYRQAPEACAQWLDEACALAFDEGGNAEMKKRLRFWVPGREIDLISASSILPRERRQPFQERREKNLMGYLMDDKIPLERRKRELQSWTGILKAAGEVEKAADLLDTWQKKLAGQGE